MTEAARPGGPDLAAVFAALSTGVVVYDAQRRITFLNPAFERILGLPAGLFRPGTSMEEVVRLVAHRGIYGPGDPETLAAKMMTGDDRVARHYTWHSPDGGIFESQYLPLATGFAVSVTDTTRLSAVREQAKQASERVDEAIAQFRVGLAVFGSDRRLSLHNARLLELLGLPGPSPRTVTMTGTPFGELLRAAGQTTAFETPDGAEFLTLQRAQDRSRTSQTTWRRPDGVVVAFQSDPLATGGWTMTLLDITAQAAAEDEVRRRAAVLEAIIANMPSGVVVYGPDQRISVINDAYRAVMYGAAGTIGEREDELIRRQAIAGEFGPGDPADITRARIAALDQISTSIHRRQRPTGQTVEIRKAQLSDGGAVRVLTDVSNEVAAEAERTQHADTMAKILSHIRHGIVLWDRDQRIIAANTVATELLGAEPNLFVPGATLEQILTAGLNRGNFGHDADAHRFADTLLHRDRTGSYVDQRLTCNGRVLEVCSDPTPDGGFITTYTDVTPIHHPEAAPQNVKAVPERGNLAKSGLLAAMGQELRRPLVQMMEQAELIRRELAGLTHGTSPALAAADTALQTGQAILDRLGTILDIAHLEAGRFSLADNTIPIGSLITDALTNAAAAAAVAKVTLTASLTGCEPVILGDRRRLLDALENLIRYALTLTRPGETLTLTATAPSGEEARGLAVTVTSPTATLDSAAIEQAFNAFSPSEDPTDHQPVLRLGLYASRIVLQAHGGTVQLQSAPGRGAVATILLPPARVLSPASTSTTSV